MTHPFSPGTEAAMPFDDRRRRLRESFDAAGIEGLIVGSETNVGYLTGFTGDSSDLVLTPDRAIVISDGRFAVQLAQECPDLEVVIRPIGQQMAEGVGLLAKSLAVRRLGFESQSTTVAEFQALREAAEGVELVPKQGLVERLRMVKDEAEIAALRDAIAVAERAFLDLRGWLRPGVTEKAAADFLEAALRSRGATDASFPPIVAVGPRAALPHARPSGAIVGENALILVDWGARRDGYRSDLTRVVTTGKVAAEFEHVYRTVLEAQGAAIAAIRPGVEARAVDGAARAVIEGAGFGPRFNHSVGHGIGRDVHEAPILRHVSETVLQPGMVVTVEPGAYFPEWGGVRIEDDVLVTAAGAEVLSTLAKSPDSLGL